MATEDATENSASQARAQFESIAAYMTRIEHASECTEVYAGYGDEDGDCDADEADIFDGLGIWRLGDALTTDDMREEYHDEEKAREAALENALSVEIRSGWETDASNLTPAEYNILLCTGGPAVRIIGDLDQHCEPSSARLQHQDWGTPWTELILASDEYATLRAYASLFYFGS